ncbi:hypothetical protein Bcav_0740 [Beutenbergia cavernae DSM 12333]|uniref:AbiEi antitoxin C-terminal domain-containing protein n=1 Tax=Beutenbergia cavernae (strain ATCC BAA-8 / DSM 12333 / CCUG 43141 / JCM 11478 / NBRC 16432 / NCIMB 13614 / HKI 0122) TaxID=471853 RepID=C5BYP3_BEUC1|nr:hypothetical protein [Beutenbergia cavernae]ACQ79001.1 hypothetical protein Bcav_0740 [Beutenbergia cavernae DSM 12333]
MATVLTSGARAVTPPVPRTLPALVRPGELARPALRSEVAAGRLAAVGRSACVVVDPQLPVWQRRERLHLARVRADHEALTGEHHFARESAALLYGWPVWRCPDAPIILRTSSPGARAASGRRWSYAALDVDDGFVHTARCEHPDCEGHDLPVTARARTAADCARLLRPLDALVVVDGALRDGVQANDLLARVAAMRGARGVRQARALIPFADALAESAGESWVRWLAVAHGLPRPHLQQPVDTATGTFWLDGYWPQVRVGWEYDGLAKYGSSEDAVRRSLLAEKRRSVAVGDARITLLHFDTTDVAAPRRAVERLRAAIPSEHWGPPIPALGPMRAH